MPASFTLFPAPVSMATILVPDVMPDPLRVCPTLIAPDVMPVTVKVVPEIDPVIIAPI